MIGDHINGTKFACTYSYCPDKLEMEVYREMFVCVYSHKYTDEENVYKKGEPGDYCKTDSTFQCLCAGGGKIEFPCFFVFFVLYFFVNIL